jgi:hypothetical protein
MPFNCCDGLDGKGSYLPKIQPCLNHVHHHFPYINCHKLGYTNGIRCRNISISTAFPQPRRKAEKDMQAAQSLRDTEAGAVPIRGSCWGW